MWVPGSLKAVKAIGWFIEEYGIAQISINLTNAAVTPVHVAFDEVCKKAEARGVRVTGSEIVGMVPLKALLDAGKHYLRKQHRSIGVSEAELVKIAVKSLGLSELAPFKPEERVIEYALAGKGKKRLIDLTLAGFVEETASESVAPGGGSVSAAVGAFGAALGAMVANLSAHKPGWDARWEEFSDWAERGQRCCTELLALVDRDTEAFNAVLAAFGLPKATPEEKAARAEAVQAATRGAIVVPLRVMEVAIESLEVLRAMAEQGNPNSVSDAGVGALCARTAVEGAGLNVRINAKGLTDKGAGAELVARAEALVGEARSLAAAVLAAVEARL